VFSHSSPWLGPHPEWSDDQEEKRRWRWTIMILLTGPGGLFSFRSEGIFWVSAAHNSSAAGATPGSKRGGKEENKTTKSFPYCCFSRFDLPPQSDCYCLFFSL
jgi:hypothetical protein